MTTTTKQVQRTPEDDLNPAVTCNSYDPNIELRARIAELEAALAHIANGDERPGHVHYISKGRMAAIAQAALAKAEAK